MDELLLHLSLEDRLSDEAIHTHFKGMGLEFLLGVGGDTDNPRLFCDSLFTQKLEDLGDRLGPVHVRHLVVHEDEAEVGEAGVIGPLLNNFDSLGPIAGHRCLDIELLNKALDGHLVELVVVNDHHAVRFTLVHGVVQLFLQLLHKGVFLFHLFAFIEVDVSFGIVVLIILVV